MKVRFERGCVEVWTPAKLNLFLEILAKRNDGFHEIETVMLPVSIYDTLRFTATERPALSIHCDWAPGLQARDRRETVSRGSVLWPRLPAERENLVFRALERLQQASAVSRGAVVRLCKRIPCAAGFGGASSDAAAALVAANMGWDLHWSRDELKRIGAEIGSDVPFFIDAQAAVARGRGERIETIHSAGRLYFVMIRPPEGLATPMVYRHCRPAAEPVSCRGMVEALRRGRASEVGKHFLNRLQPAAARLSPWIEKLQEEFRRYDVWGHQMSGSGSGYFGLCRNVYHARRIVDRLRAQGFGHAYHVVSLAPGRGSPADA